MLLSFFRVSVLIVLNYFLILNSKYIDTYQLLEDISFISNVSNTDMTLTYAIVCISVSLLTIFLVSFFKPFIEIYLLHYSRYLFYLLVSLISLSSVYIVFRVYGYSRTWMILYIFFTAAFLMFSDKLKRFKFFATRKIE